MDHYSDLIQRLCYATGTELPTKTYNYNIRMTDFFFITIKTNWPQRRLVYVFQHSADNQA